MEGGFTFGADDLNDDLGLGGGIGMGLGGMSLGLGGGGGGSDDVFSGMKLDFSGGKKKKQQKEKKKKKKASRSNSGRDTSYRAASSFSSSGMSRADEILARAKNNSRASSRNRHTPAYV